MRVKSKRHHARFATRNSRKQTPKWVFITEYYTQPLWDFLKHKIYDKFSTFVIKTKIEKFQDWLYYRSLDLPDSDNIDNNDDIFEAIFRKPSVRRSLKLHDLSQKNTKVYKRVGSGERPKSWPKP